MFRTKTKKKSAAGAAGADGGGGAQRKRKAAPDVDADDTDVAGGAAAAAAVGGGGGGDGDGDADEGDADDALLQRMRERNSARRGRASAAAVGAAARRISAALTSNTSSSGGGGALSFEAESVASRKTRMQPNLLQDASGGDAAAPSASSYSQEALAALRKQQNVLLRGGSEPNGAEHEEGETVAEQVDGDVAMDEIDGATVVVEENGDGGDGEEFIPLRSQLLQARKKRSRVTFGVHESAEPPPPIPEVAEVDGDVVADNDDDDDEGRQWEEDVMRRGGLRAHPAAPSAPDVAASRSDRSAVYPTRRRVPSGSLAGVLSKLQRSLDAANSENDRAERELARIGADAALVKARAETQRAQLLAASDEFEYFQVVEDYVRGLSFCLREKLREIDASEREVARLRVENVRSLRDADAKRARDVADTLAAVGAIVSADLPGLRIFEASGDCALPSTGSASADSELAKLLQHEFVDRTPAIRQSEPEGDGGALDVFADAVDEMSSLEHVYGRFQEWRSKFPQVYESCFCDLALETLYAAYVRAELLFWDPLSVCATPAASAKPWGFGSFKWCNVLLQHVRKGSSASGAGVDDGPVAALVRDVVLAKTLSATALYFDPFSSLHTRSICALLEEVASRDGYAIVSAQALRRVVGEAAAQFAAVAKLVPLVAVGEKRADRSAATVADFAAYQLSRFNVLLDNALTLFVALPRGVDAGQSAGFQCVMQLLHQLLAFLRHCTCTQRRLLVPQAVRTVSQLAGSPHLQQQLLAASPSQERELQHVLELFRPFMISATTETIE